MRQMKGWEVWEAAKIVAAAAALILLAFGIVLGLGDAIAFPERQPVAIFRDLTGSLPPAGQPPKTATVPERGMHDPPAAQRGPEMLRLNNGSDDGGLDNQNQERRTEKRSDSRAN